MVQTNHRYQETLHNPGRPARTTWHTDDAKEAVAATLSLEPQAIITSVYAPRSRDFYVLGYMPGGIAA
jgi:hypothetical protein